jgi:hypothetical protein
MTTPDNMGAILRLTELAEKLGALDAREGEHFGRLAAQLGELAAAVTDGASELSRHGEILAVLDGLDQQVLELARHVAALSELPDDGEGKPGPYKPEPSVKWWAIDADGRAEAIRCLAAWVQDIYVPGYGFLAAMLPACWPQHELILYSLDTLSQLWMVLYLNPERSPSTLAGQAEFQTRVLPLYVAQIREEVRDCGHRATAARALR